MGFSFLLLLTLNVIECSDSHSIYYCYQFIKDMFVLYIFIRYEYEKSQFGTVLVNFLSFLYLSVVDVFCEEEIHGQVIVCPRPVNENHLSRKMVKSHSKFHIMISGSQ